MLKSGDFHIGDIVVVTWRTALILFCKCLYSPRAAGELHFLPQHGQLIVYFFVYVLSRCLKTVSQHVDILWGWVAF